MSFSSRSYVNRYIPSNRFPVGVKWLLIVTTGISVLDLLLRGSRSDVFLQNFALVPSQVVQTFAVWELVTYMFLHAGVSHVLWNMLALWLFGIELERAWGTKRFVRFYFECGIIAAITVVIAAYVFGNINFFAVGASGAVCGILAGYGVAFPDQTVLFGFLIPMKAKYFAMIIGAVILYQSFTAVRGGGAGLAVLMDLGGLIAGYLLLRGGKLRQQVRQPLVAGYKYWKLRRAKKKFQVYLKKKDSGRDRWVH